MRILLAVLADIRSTPLRTLAAILGMVAAVVSVIVVDSASVLSRRANDEYTERTFGKAITALVAPTFGHSIAAAQGVLSSNGVSLISRVSPQIGDIHNDEGVVPGAVAVVAGTYNQIFVVNMVAGAWPVKTARSIVPHAVVSTDFVSGLRLRPADVVGQRFSFVPFQPDSGPSTVYDRVVSFVVDGVAATDTNAFNTATATVLWVSEGYSDEQARSLQTDRLYLRVDPGDFALVQGLVGGLTTVTGAPQFEVVRVDLSTDIAPILDQQNVTAQAVTWIALIIGGLGVLSVGLANVRERAFEFGVRRALGATRLRLFSVVLVHTITEALLAAVLGIGVAAVILDRFERRLVLSSLPLPGTTDLPLSSAARGIIGALLVGLIAGAIPAFRAARVSVIHALRG